jgi:hypothetical protein
MRPPPLLSMDAIQLTLSNITHLHSKEAVPGNLYITKYQLIFQPANNAVI